MCQAPDQSFLPFARPDIGEAEIAAVAAAMRSGWVTTGPQARAFEEEFAAFIGGGVQAVAVNSATAGLHLALEALGIGAGDEVIVPSLTFTATAEVARYLGADVRLVDVDARTLCVDAAAVEAAITPRTRAMLPVHYGGLACDMAALHALAERHGLHVVEDAAHALPTTSGGHRIGSLAGSSAAVFSFYANKTMTTGEGGMAVVRDAKLAARMRVMRLHGIDRDAFARFTSRTPAWYYEVVAPGFKYNMTDVAAALGRVQLQRVEAMAQRRAALAARPHLVQPFMWSNPRGVFFKEEAISAADASAGPRGAQGVPLTAGRSIAVDPKSIPYGTPVWLVSSWPAASLQRLVLAQDTGSAITGAVRADFFAGTGEAAGTLAGSIKQPLYLWVLWPK